MALVTEDQIATPKSPAAKSAFTLITSGKIDPFIPEARRKDAAFLYSACLQEFNAREQVHVDHYSIGQCLAASAKLWLPPGVPENLCNFVPRQDDKVYKFTWTLGYRGIVLMAYRSGFLVRLDAEYVVKGERFRYRHTSDRGIRIAHEIPPNRGAFDMLDLECVYCTWQTKDGAVSGFVVPAWKVRAIRDRVTKVQSSSPWKTNPDAMARKTAIKHAASYLPLGEDFAYATRLDDEADDLPRPVLDVPTDSRSTDKTSASATALLRMVGAVTPEQQGLLRAWIASQSNEDGISEETAVCRYLGDEASRDAARAYLANCSTVPSAI